MEENNGNKYCSECGAEIRGKFCPQCGKPAPKDRDDSGVYSFVFDRNDKKREAEINDVETPNISDKELEHYKKLEKEYEEEIRANERAMEKVGAKWSLSRKLIAATVACIATIIAIILIVVLVPHSSKKEKSSTHYTIENITVTDDKRFVLSFLGDPAGQSADGLTYYWLDQVIISKEQRIVTLLQSSNKSDWQEAARLLNELSGTKSRLVAITFDFDDYVQKIVVDTNHVYGSSVLDSDGKSITSQVINYSVSAIGKFVGGIYTIVPDISESNYIGYEIKFDDGSFAKGRTLDYTVNRYGTGNVCIISFYNGLCQSTIFKEVTELRGVIIENSNLVIKGNYSSSDLGIAGHIIIPNSVTSIGREAFYNCSSLESVVIPNSVTIIGQFAFSGCSRLTDIYCEADVKPSGWSNDWNKGCPARVHWGYII